MLPGGCEPRTREVERRESFQEHMLSMCKMLQSNLTLFLSPRPLLSLLVSNQLHPLHLSHLPLSRNHGGQKEISMRLPHHLNPPHPYIFHHPHTLRSLHHPHTLQHPHTLHHPHSFQLLMMNMSGLKSHFRYQCSVVHVSDVCVYTCVRVCVYVCVGVCMCLCVCMFV